jgi:prepilin-type processing-associated H-X9-DG protein
VASAAHGNNLINICMGDGSVKSIQRSNSLQFWYMLSTPSGGETIPDSAV